MAGIVIRSTALDVHREPLVRPLGFKGNSFSEKWIARTTLKDQQGFEADGVGGFAVLWSDGTVYAEHAEVAGNAIVLLMLDHALRLVEGTSFDTPVNLLDRLLPDVYAYGQLITGREDLSPTLALNSLVALDDAAWRLYARHSGARTFAELVPEPFRAAFPHRHQALAHVPTISYNVPLTEVRQLAEQGTFVFKIKIGAAGDPMRMLEADLRRISEVHQVLERYRTPHTDDGRLRYYLDANGRYPDRDLLAKLLDQLDSAGVLEHVCLFEEPYSDHGAAPVTGLGVTVAADESLHDPSDVRRRAEAGYRALALKPAGKTLTMSLRMAAEAHELGLACFVADSGCTPRMADWNRQVAAHLPPLAGLSTGLLESNGAQNYRNWSSLVAQQPDAATQFLESRRGLFQLNESFYTTLNVRG